MAGADEDRFGHDPHVAVMRQVFARMEAWERTKLEELDRKGLPRLDPRLRIVRERTLTRYNRAAAAARGRTDADLLVSIYQAAFEEELLALGLPGGRSADDGPLAGRPALASAVKEASGS